MLFHACGLLHLQVLEYLAAREILTLEHISVGPPCPGMERLEAFLSFCFILLIQFMSYFLCVLHVQQMVSSCVTLFFSTIFE